MKISKCQQEGGDCILVEQLSHFDLGQIKDSGQCFRIYERPAPTDARVKRSFSVCRGEDYIRVDQWKQPETVLFHCDEEAFQTKWFFYFGFDQDYFVSLEKHLVDDPFLFAAAQYGSGIRILRQDFWEMLISFLISQNNHIKRIQMSIEALCKTYGASRMERGDRYHTFPTPKALKGADLSGLGLGYRQDYLERLCKREQLEDWLDTVRSAESYEKAREQLLQIHGVGEKVANCILLFGLHYLNAYPVDTWIRKMIQMIYGGQFDTTPYQSYAGYVQQLQFYYYRTQYKTRNLCSNAR